MRARRRCRAIGGELILSPETPEVVELSRMFTLAVKKKKKRRHLPLRLNELQEFFVTVALRCFVQGRNFLLPPPPCFLLIFNLPPSVINSQMHFCYVACRTPE